MNILTIIKELLPEAVRGLNAGEASESAGSPCPRPKSAGVAHVLFIKGDSLTHLCHVIDENE